MAVADTFGKMTICMSGKSDNAGPGAPAPKGPAASICSTKFERGRAGHQHPVETQI